MYLDNRNSGDICVSRTAIWTQNNTVCEKAFLSSFYEINNVCGNIKTVYQNVEHQVQWHPEYYWTHHISCMLIVSYKLLVTLLNFNVNAMSGWNYVKPKFNFLPNFGGILWSVLHRPPWPMSWAFTVPPAKWGPQKLPLSNSQKIKSVSGKIWCSNRHCCKDINLWTVPLTSKLTCLHSYRSANYTDSLVSIMSPHCWITLCDTDNCTSRQQPEYTVGCNQGVILKVLSWYFQLEYSSNVP